MSQTVTIGDKQTLSEIVQNKYHLKGWSSIQAKCEEIKLFNNQNNKDYKFTDIGKILAGKTLVLPDAVDTQTSSVSDAEAKTASGADSTPAKKPEEPNLGKKFDGWIESCADSLTGETDENKEPTYKHDVSPLNMARTPEYKTALDAARKTGDYDEVNNVYRKNVDALAGSIVDNADTDGDGMLSVKEFIKKEEDDLKKKISGSESGAQEFAFDEESEKEFERLFTRQFLMMDLDTPEKLKPEDVKDLRITKREYAAFLKAVDRNNKQNIADGEITRDEYLGMTKILEGNDNKALIAFKKKERDSYKDLYDPKPAIGI